MCQVLPDAERRTGEAIASGSGIDDNAAVEAIKAERQQANQVKLNCTRGRQYDSGFMSQQPDPRLRVPAIVRSTLVLDTVRWSRLYACRLLWPERS